MNPKRRQNPASAGEPGCDAGTQAILDAAPDAIVTTDRNGRILTANLSTTKLFCYSQAELIGADIRLLLDIPGKSSYPKMIGLAFDRRDAGELHFHSEVRARRKDGTEFPVEITLTESAVLGQVIGLFHDISRRRALEFEAIHAAMEERMKNARDLHDGLGSALTAIHLRTELLARKMKQACPGEHEEVRDLARLLKRALEDVRLIAQDIHAVGDHPEDLGKALDALVRRNRETTQAFKFSFHYPQPVEIPDPLVGNHLFRIAQEAITNALKYSGGTRIRVSLTRSEGNVRLTITDDGKGCDPAVVTIGAGIAIMRFRCDAINGSFELKPRRPRGACVICRAPL